MRNYVMLILSLLLCSFFIGCSGKKTTSQKVQTIPENNIQKSEIPSSTTEASTQVVYETNKPVDRTLGLVKQEGKVLFIFIRPNNLLSNPSENIHVDGQNRTMVPAKEIVAFYVEPGRQYLFSNTGTTPAIKAKFKAGKTYYFYNPDDAKSQILLGDLLYDIENFDGSIAAYRKAVKIDSTVTGFYKRYSELVVIKGKADEIERVMRRVISRGQADATTFLGLGKVYQKRKIYPKAILEFRKCLEQEPENANAMLAIADCKAKQGKTDEAIQLFEKAIPLNPSSPDEYKTLGDLYIKQKQTIEAMGAYKRFLNNGGKNSTIAQKVGNWEFARRNYVEAAKYLEMVKGKKAKSATHLLNLSESYYHAGEFEKAVPKFKSLMSYGLKIERKKQVMVLLAKSYENINAGNKALYWYNKLAKLQKRPSTEVSYKRAFLREKTKKAEAIKIYEQNIKRFPNDYRNFLRLGILYSKKKSTLSKSAAILKRAVKLADTSSAAWIEIARVYGKLGRGSDEIAANKKYLSFNPDSPEANARMGIALVNKGRISEGMSFLEKAYAKKPNNVSILVSLAKGHSKSGNPDKALELLLKVKSKRPKDIKIKKMLIVVYKQIGRNDEALSEMEELIGMKPDNTTRFQYATLLHKEKRLSEAINVIEDIRATDPENIKVLLLLGQIFKEQKNYEDAIDIFKEITFIDQSNAMAIYHLAEVYFAQSKPLWAEKYYKNALKLNSRLGLAEYGLAKIAKLRNRDSLYKQHLTRAYQLNPNEPEIKSAYAKK